QPTQNTAPAVAEQPASASAAAPRPLLTEGEPTRLVIPSIGIDAAVIPVGWNVIERNGQQFSIWQVADFAVGWHKTTPALGQIGNTVMAGHHNVNGEVFRDLVNLEVGDKVIAYSEGEMREYEVELKTIIKEKGEPPEVRRRNAQWISPTDDERLTFVTCWPYTNNTHRVIVVAKPTT
ncbi:MAG: sortase, partial [Anaerolineae bacterium]|nr:sortase [Anaerolineae bacterium]